MDNILIASTSMEEHIKLVQIVFERFEKYGVIINPVKCEFGKSDVIFWQHFINSAGISLSLSKVEAIAECPAPDTLRKFWGMINFYRKFLFKCAQVLKPLIDMLTDVKNCHILLTIPTLAAFKEIKNGLSQAVRLSHVVPGNPLCLVVDTSSTGVKAVLQQEVDDH